jgi:RepB plasmid partitioning protein/ParB-like nuclease domain
MTAKRIRTAFGLDLLVLPLASLVPTKEVTERVKRSAKYRCIAATIEEVGLVEPLVVYQQPVHRGRHLLLDGHLRRAILMDQGHKDVECLLAADDEGFTYNKRINRLAVVQEHFLIVRAIDRGISEAKLAKTLGVEINYVKCRKRLLKGITTEAINLLKDKPVSPVVFDLLRKMKPARQAEACRLMNSSSTYSLSYARALLSASADSDLVWPRRRPPLTIVTPTKLALMEQELKTAQENFKAVETAYGYDMVGLAIATRYVANLLQRAAIVRFLDDNHPEMLTELRNILSTTSMETPEEKLAQSDPNVGDANPNRKKSASAFVPRRGRKWQRSTSANMNPNAPR